MGFFGEKDFQQLQVIRQMVSDLDIPVRIEGVPTWRETDGLAMSSRNAYLAPAERALAPTLYRVLQQVAADLKAGETAAIATGWGKQALMRAGFSHLDYLDVVDAATLQKIEQVERPARVAAAAWLGKTRLIDNLPVAF